MNVLRVLLLPSAALAGWISLAYIFGDDQRTSTPSFRVARDLAPMEAWGALFGIGAGVLLISGLIGKLTYVSLALFIGGFIYTWWGSLFLVTVVLDTHTSLVAPALYYFIGFTHFAGAWRIYTRQPRA